MNSQQKQRFILEELKELRDEIYEEFKNEPATIAVIEALHGVDRVIDVFESTTV